MMGGFVVTIIVGNFYFYTLRIVVTLLHFGPKCCVLF
jgi:hypothetical protein